MLICRGSDGLMSPPKDTKENRLSIFGVGLSAPEEK